MQQPMNFCPKCGKDDQIQKVSSIVAAGTSFSSLSGTMSGVAIGKQEVSPVFGGSTVNGETRTNLAARLSPAQEPTVVGILFWLSMIIVVPWTFVWGIVYPIAILGTIFEASGLGEAIGMLFFSIIGVPFCLAIGWCPAHFARRHYLKKKKEYFISHSLWEVGMLRWRKMYYCYRDDLIFDPSTGDALGDTIHNAGIFN